MKEKRVSISAIYSLLSLLFVMPLGAKGIELDLFPLEEMLKGRDAYTSVYSIVIQEKVLPSLEEPLVSTGELWLQPQKAFRFEQGEPVTNIAIFSGDEVKLIDEQTKTVEVHSIKSRSIRPLMLLLGMGEDASYEGLLDSFEPIRVEHLDDYYSITFEPDSGLMKRAVKELTLVLDLKNSFPEMIIWEQKDGAVVTTKFEAPQFNVPLESELFTYSEEVYVEK